MSTDCSPKNRLRPRFFSRGFNLGIVVTGLTGLVVLFLIGIADYNRESARASEFRQLNTRTEKVNYLLRLHEGVVFAAYDDSLGNATGGVGHLLKGKYSQGQIDEWRQGIPESLVWRWLAEDTAKAESLLENRFANEQWFQSAPDRVMIVLTDMTFNMGIGREDGSKGLLSFRQMVENLRSGNWEGASEEMLDSLWRYQTGKRAHRLAYLMRHGELGTAWLPQFYLDYVKLRLSTLLALGALLLATVGGLRHWWCNYVEVRSFNELSLNQRVLYILQRDGRSSNCGAISNALVPMERTCGSSPWFDAIRENDGNALAVLLAASIAMGGWETFQGPENVEIFECAEESDWQRMPLVLAGRGAFNRTSTASFVSRVLA